MGLANAVVRLVSDRRLSQLSRRAADPGPVQERVLAQLVRRARNTEWGRAHDYAGIRSMADFQDRVALATFADVQPLWRRIEAGERDVTWPGRTRYFAVSAGTTSGSKHVPVTADAICANRRGGRDTVALCFQQMQSYNYTGGYFLYLGGSTTLRPSEVAARASAGGRPPRRPALVGDASGIMNARVPSYVRRHRLPEPDIAALSDWEEKIERLCQRYVTAPVQVLSGLPSWVVPLFERLIAVGRQRIGRQVQTVSDVWPGLGALVSFGMALEPYFPTLKALVGRPICYINTYSSSEAGMTAVQDRQVPNGGQLPGMLIIPDNGVFYEFVRLDEIEDPHPRRWTLADVERGVPYELVVSTNGGIWAYRLGDVVRFETLRPHRLVMSGRTHHQLSAFGEHVIAEELEVAIMAGCEATGAEVANFAVQAVFPKAAAPRSEDPAGEHGRHRWYVEFRRSPSDPDAFLTALDERLIALNEDYASYRKGDTAIAPPEMVPLAPETFYEWMKRAGRLGGQFKIPRVLTDAAEAERLKAVSDELARNPKPETADERR